LPTSRSLIDDRLLVARLVGERVRLPRGGLTTTSYWYCRGCRAAIVGGAGQLSGPFALLGPREQAAAIRTMLSLPEDIELPDPRELVPAMVTMHQRHPLLNVMNVEAAAAAGLLGAQVLLSARGADGILPEASPPKRSPGESCRSVDAVRPCPIVRTLALLAQALVRYTANAAGVGLASRVRMLWTDLTCRCDPRHLQPSPPNRYTFPKRYGTGTTVAGVRTLGTDDGPLHRGGDGSTAD
jgi:hypothetical protein